MRALAMSGRQGLPLPRTATERVQTAKGELGIETPQLRRCAEKLACRVIPDTRTILRSRSLEALVIEACVRGLSDRGIESLLQKAGLGRLSKSKAGRICRG